MIRRARPADSRPKSLRLNVGTSAAAKELKAVVDWINAGRPDPKKLRPAFKAYKSADVAPALETLFERKCAYCESPYASLHPVDVEHWRPKAEIEGVIGGGYEWLAMEWENLLPSCIDCNRARRQLIPDSTAPNGVREEKLGKANQFPLADPASRWTSHTGPNTEAPLLLNPCTDDPSEFFDFDPSGVLLPKAGLDAARKLRATESIRVYALNRKSLVDERRRHVLRLELIFDLIRFLFTESANPAHNQTFRDTASALVEETLDRLKELTEPGVPYSQFIGQRLRVFLKDELGAN